jgi:hypothetical protein
MAEKQIKFSPFHAINDFMRPDYRTEVITLVVSSLNDLPESDRKSINAQTKHLVQVPGFRNSSQAPARLRIKPTISAFEKSPQLAAAVIAAWATLHAELRQEVYDLLVSRGWELLPPDADRTRLPGFLTTWPQDEDFEKIDQAFSEKYPDHDVSGDDVSLMTVWLAGRLPYQQEGEEDRSQQV